MTSRTALIFPNAQSAEFKRRELEALGIDKQYHCIFPLMALMGYRFSNVFVSDVTHQNIVRGSTMVRRWFHEQVMIKLDKDAQVIILP